MWIFFITATTIAHHVVDSFLSIANALGEYFIYFQDVPDIYGLYVFVPSTSNNFPPLPTAKTRSLFVSSLRTSLLLLPDISGVPFEHCSYFWPVKTSVLWYDIFIIIWSWFWDWQYFDLISVIIALRVNLHQWFQQVWRHHRLFHLHQTTPVVSNYLHSITVKIWYMSLG